MAGFKEAKTISLSLDRERVRERVGARVFTVRGNTGIDYTVVIGGGGPTICTCPGGMSGRRCHHAEAVALRRRPDQFAVIQGPRA